MRKPITAQQRKDCWQQLYWAQRRVTKASGILGEGNEEVRALMVDVQKLLIDTVAALDGLEVQS